MTLLVLLLAIWFGSIAHASVQARSNSAKKAGCRSIADSAQRDNCIQKAEDLTSPQSSPLPRHDVDADCQGMVDRFVSSGERAARDAGVAIPPRSNDNTMFNVCVEREQLGYDYLKSVWNDVPAAIKTTCLANANGERPRERWVLYYGLYQCISGRYEIYRLQNQRRSFQPE